MHEKVYMNIVLFFCCCLYTLSHTFICIIYTKELFNPQRKEEEGKKKKKNYYMGDDIVHVSSSYSDIAHG